MAIGLVGRKCGMTQVFTEEGAAIPVTILEVTPNRVTQIKTIKNDGYSAIQVTADTCKVSKLTKPMAGHFMKSGVEPGAGLWEFLLDTSDNQNIELGQSITLDIFTESQKVDITGITKGKGFAGVVKRHHFATQDATHGNSLSHRAPGSIGQRQSPGRVFKGKRMAGQMGNKKRTVQSQMVVKIDLERNLLFLKGAVPGAVGGRVIILPAVRHATKQNAVKN